MGLCSSTAVTPEEQLQKQRSNDLDKRMNKEQAKESAIIKLLLLGAGESGKSTLFKQMIQIYGKGFPVEERRGFIPIVHNNIIASMKSLCLHVDTYGGMPLLPESEDGRRVVVEQLKGDEILDEKTASMIQQLWRDPAIQATYEQRSLFQLYDSAKYFLDQITEVMNPEYIPSEQDVLRSRVRTTGIVENEFVIEGNTFKMFDVGGQRNERKKWIHCFENVTGVIFVAAISEYDQVLYEDESTNRMTEALNLFEEICNSRWFRQTAMILFLNKCDLFRDKLHRVPLSQYFSDYHGDNSYDSACDFVNSQFQKRCRNPTKQIYCHITCATNTENVSVVFNAVKDIIIRASLAQAGLM